MDVHRTLAHGHELQRMGVHAGEWIRRSGLQSQDAIIELPGISKKLFRTTQMITSSQ